MQRRQPECGGQPAAVPLPRRAAAPQRPPLLLAVTVGEQGRAGCQDMPRREGHMERQPGAAAPWRVHGTARRTSRRPCASAARLDPSTSAARACPCRRRRRRRPRRRRWRRRRRVGAPRAGRCPARRCAAGRASARSSRCCRRPRTTPSPARAPAPPQRRSAARLVRGIGRSLARGMRRAPLFSCTRRRSACCMPQQRHVKGRARAASSRPFACAGISTLPYCAVLS